MAENVRFDLRSEKPSLDLYRRDWAPAPGMALSGMWLGAVVTDDSGEYYLGLRGADDYIPGTVHVVAPVCGFQKLATACNTHLFTEFASVDFFEPFDFVESENCVAFVYGSGRIEREADGCHWYDASGRWEMHGKTVSDVVIVTVPMQDGVDHDVSYRHELMLVEGRIGDVAVRGHLHHDYGYGPPGYIFPELPIPRKLQGMWVSWVHEYADGEVGGGCFWQGRGDLVFGPGYQLKDGVTTTYSDITSRATFGDNGMPIGLDATIGGDSYHFVFDRQGSPVHMYGYLDSTSLARQPARSWCWVEYANAMLTPEMLDLSLQRFRIARGR